jgi:glycosyltransferase involved in cell wall biosynthesis
MRILFDLSFIRYNIYAGVSKYAYRILDYVVEEKLCDNITLLLNTVSKEIITKSYPQFNYIAIGPSVFKPIPILRTIWTSLSFNYNVNKLDFDVVFCPFANEITCLKTNKRIISVIHDFQLRRDTKGLILLLHQLIDNRIIKNSHKIVTISEFSKNDILKYYPYVNEKIVVLGNSVSLPNEISKNIINEPYILFVGRVCELKNLITLIKAYILVNNEINHKLVIVGDKNQYWSNVILPLIQKAEISNKVIVISACKEEELASLYKYADLFVFPSLREGFGSPPIEAAIQEIPVIVSQCESIPEVTMGLTHSYDNVMDENELAFKIIDVVNNPDSTEKLKSIASIFLSNYNITTVGSRIVNFIENV